MAKRSCALWICVSLFVATFALYFQAGKFEFVGYDDPQFTASQANHGLTWDGVIWAFTSNEASNWFPLTRLSHMLDFQLFGAQSGFHHLTNALLHALAAIFLFAFLHRATRAIWPSAAVAFIFALHPLHVESVAWVSERKDVLSACFGFLTLWAYVYYTEHPGLNRYRFVFVAFCFGLMAKPMLVTIPFLLLLLDFWPLRRSKGRIVLEKIPLFFYSAASVLVTYLVQKQGGATDMIHIPIGMRIENALVSYVTYLGKTFWPTNLAVLYPYPPAIPAWEAVAAFITVAGISFFVIRLYQGYPYLAIGWFWFLGTLVPVIGLVQVGIQARADRYMYIPMTGISIMIAWGAADLVRRWPQAKPAVLAFAAVIVSIGIAMSWIQIQYWKNSEALYRHALAVTEENYMMHYNLATVLAEVPGKRAEAIFENETALRIKPDYVEAHNNLGAMLADIPSRLPEAIAQYEIALRIDPDSVEAHCNLAAALAKRSGRLRDAINEYETALRIRPDDVKALNGLGAALAKVPGRLPEAIEKYHAALQIKPDYVEARNNLAVAMSDVPGHLTDAISEYEATLRINPRSAEAHNNLGSAFAKMPGRMADAIQEYEAALQIAPDFAEAHYNLGAALAQVPDRLADAIKEYETAMLIRPDYLDAHINLGVALARSQGRVPDAISEFRVAVRIAPESAKAHSNLGVVLAQIPGGMTEAISEFESAFRISGDPILRKQVDELRNVSKLRR